MQSTTERYLEKLDGMSDFECDVKLERVHADMDEETREQLHAMLGPKRTTRAFLAAYIREHDDRFDEPFYSFDG